MSLTDALCTALMFGALAAADLQAAQREVVVALRADDRPGSGTAADPFDGSGPDQLDWLFKMFREKYGDRLKISFGPGTYYGTRLAAPKSDWTICGAGIDKTVFKTAPNPDSTRTFGFRGPPCERFRLSDVTFDFNIAALRNAPGGHQGQGRPDSDAEGQGQGCNRCRPAATIGLKRDELS